MADHGAEDRPRPNFVVRTELDLLEQRPELIVFGFTQGTNGRRVSLSGTSPSRTVLGRRSVFPCSC